MDNKYDVTIPLIKYDRMQEICFKYGNILKRFEEIIEDTNRLNWKKDDLDLPDELIDLMKIECKKTYLAKVEKLKRELENKNDK